MFKYFIKNNLFPYLLLFILIAQNAKADIFAFQNTPPSQLWVNNQKGCSYLSVNGIYLFPGGSKYIGPDWNGKPGLGAALRYGRCFIDNIGIDFDVAYYAVDAEYNEKVDNGKSGRTAVNITYNIINGDQKDSLGNVVSSRPSLAVQAGYAWSSFAFHIQYYAVPEDMPYCPMSVNYENSGFEVPLGFGLSIPISHRLSTQLYFKYIYHCQSNSYQVPVYQYNVIINDYDWYHDQFDELRKYNVIDYGFALGFIPFNKKKSIKMFSGCSLSKADDQKENNISFSFGLMKEWGKKYK
ncbi:MAG: hypothetical protein KJ620_04305 [Candidatus Edwardsbacteria bacterium]|nr:hypothetical protein [Candidatus Edwardsbacteria bacterium]MBU1576386.1 hypothetical protein [Candidatus Edwardsbacteria bacterium]MBU2463847.1 hypothetical protein [Candidatus Edwardsbacteria bacterium]MBU2593563.1 hypothetical protein [Candidatus Edwardsbacteria bacterium]